MSKLLISLIEGKYRDMLQSSRDGVINSLRNEVVGYDVSFTWLGRKNKHKPYKLTGKVSNAGFDKNDQMMVTISFINPERNQKETTARYITELSR